MARGQGPGQRAGRPAGAAVTGGSSVHSGSLCQHRRGRAEGGWETEACTGQTERRAGPEGLGGDGKDAASSEVDWRGTRGTGVGQPEGPQGLPDAGRNSRVTVSRGESGSAQRGKGFWGAVGVGCGEPRGACLPHTGVCEVHVGGSAGAEGVRACGRCFLSRGGGKSFHVASAAVAQAWTCPHVLPSEPGGAQGPSGWMAGLPPPRGVWSVPQGPAVPTKGSAVLPTCSWGGLTLQLGLPAFHRSYHKDRAQLSASTASQPGPARACAARRPGRWTQPSPQSAL